MIVIFHIFQTFLIGLTDTAHKGTCDENKNANTAENIFAKGIEPIAERLCSGFVDFFEDDFFAFDLIFSDSRIIKATAEDIEVRVKGKIVLGKLVWAVLAFALTKPVRKAIIKMIKFLKNKDKA